MHSQRFGILTRTSCSLSVVDPTYGDLISEMHLVCTASVSPQTKLITVIHVDGRGALLLKKHGEARPDYQNTFVSAGVNFAQNIPFPGVKCYKICR